MWEWVYFMVGFLGGISLVSVSDDSSHAVITAAVTVLVFTLFRLVQVTIHVKN